MTTEKNNSMNEDMAKRLEGLSAKEIWQELYNKELNTKKTVLEYIEMTRALKHGNATEEQIQDTYNLIYKSIDDMASSIKPNTIMYLKNQLKDQLGKLVKDRDPGATNEFIEFFKLAYPEGDRRKDFTWVLMDINKIVDEQIWTTIKYINSWCIRDKNRLSVKQKKDIIPMIELILKRNDPKYVHPLKNFTQLQTILKIRIVPAGKGFKVLYCK